MGQNLPLALQKRLGQRQTYSPDRDRLSIQPWEIADATAAVHRGAWQHGGMAMCGAGAAKRVACRWLS
jgi:hypothetical protein